MTANPILDPSELKVHLSLLRAFHALKSQVEDASKLESAVHMLSPEERWKSFVQASVERFYGWVSSLELGNNDVVEKCPPLDVCLVWHAYMLNPGRYAKDTERLEVLKTLNVLKPRLLDLFASKSLGGDAGLQESKGLSLNGSLTTGSIEEGSYPFALDLTAAVLRQTSFTEKMVNLGWTEQGFFDDPVNSDTLQRCIARYRGFLELMSSTPNKFFVPTLDIDLAWHTHQLDPERYAVDCLKHAKRFIDHDDDVEETQLSDSFDNTCHAWEELFGVAYSFCSGTKAVLKPTSRSSSNEYGFQSIGMGPVYLGHEHGLVNGSSSACGNGCGGGCAGGCGNGRGESLCFGGGARFR